MTVQKALAAIECRFDCTLLLCFYGEVGFRKTFN